MKNGILDVFNKGLFKNEEKNNEAQNKSNSKLKCFWHSDADCNEKQLQIAPKQ